MALDRDGKAAFFTRAGQVIGSAPPLPEVTGEAAGAPAPTPQPPVQRRPPLRRLGGPAVAGTRGDGGGRVITRPLVAAAKPGTRACQNGTGHRQDPCRPPKLAQRRVGWVIPPQRNADFGLAGDWQFTTDDARVKLERSNS